VARLMRCIKTYRSLRSLIPFLTAALLFASGAGDLAISQQPKSPPVKIPSFKSPTETVIAEPTRDLSPEEIKQLQPKLDRLRAFANSSVSKDPEKAVHELLDHAAEAEDMAEPLRTRLRTTFLPRQQAIHKSLTEEIERVRKQMEQESIGGTQQPLRKSSHDSVQRPALRASDLVDRPPGLLFPLTWHPEKSFTSAEGGRKEHGARLFLAAILRGSASDTHNGVKMDVSAEIGQTDGSEIVEGLGVETDVEIAESDSSFHIGAEQKDLARVERCPTRDGIVTGSHEGRKREQAGVETTAAGASGLKLIRTTISSEAQVGDDAVIREVRMKVVTHEEERRSTRDVHGKVVSEIEILRTIGEATFDPHSFPEDIPIKILRCYTEKGRYPTALCRGSVNIGQLRRAYLGAENRWNFEYKNPSNGQPDDSHCLTAKFTPKTKTARKKPSETVDVKIEFLTKKGNQPTWGKIEQLEAVKGDGKVSPTSATFTPDTPVQVTYTAPPKPWPLNDPPGFDIVKATSRAGVIKRGQSPPEDVEWRLATVIRLAIHQRFELLFARAPGVAGGVLSDVRFFLDLAIEPDGRLSGQAVVPREESQNTSAVISGLPMNCQQRSTWTELWEAKGKLDEVTQQLMFKLRFDAGPKNIKTDCMTPNGEMKHQWATSAGTRSDSMRSPLDNLVMAAKDGEKRKYEFPVPPAKTMIEIKVVTGEGDPSDQPTKPSAPNSPAPGTPPPVVIPKGSVPPGGMELGPTDEKPYIEQQMPPKKP